MSLPIGILTFHNGPNYGGFMQAWHLRHAIQSLGHEVYTVNYLHPIHVRNNTQSQKIRSLGNLKAAIHWHLKRKPFRGLGDSLSQHPFTADPAQVEWNSFRGIVVGSDVIWDFESPEFGNDPAYFGALACQKDVPFAAYAASCGKANVDSPLPHFVGGLKQFTDIGVRDRTTARLVELAAGRQPELVVDPTWLGDDPSPLRSRRPKKPYVMLYAANVGPRFGPALKNWCRRKGYLLVSAAARCPWADITYRCLHPFEWVDLLRGAEATVVSGLHGTLYSIKYNKPFLLVNNEMTHQKSKLALEMTGQEFRRQERDALQPEHLDLLEPEGGMMPSIPYHWVDKSKVFLGRALAFAGQTQTV
jgi:hypothetical protein